MIIPKELDYLLSLEKRKDAKERIKKVYNAFLWKKGKSNSYFVCPSSYLKKVSGQYNKVIKQLIEHKIIDFQSFNNDESDIFNQRRKKYYNTDKGICARYKFLIDIEDGYEDILSIDFSTLYDKEKWYMKTRYSLLQLGFPLDSLNIKRDNFSRRLHTNITGNIGDGNSYKDLLSGGDYYSIDAKTCQPRLLWIHLQSIGLQDEKLNDIFNNDLDFYQYIIDRIPALIDRDDAKELFTSWINGTGYLDADKTSIRDIFPVANMFLRKYKTTDYKNICRLLQYKEASIFIDDLLNNINIEFCLTIHDSLIVKKEDVETALKFCKDKHPELKFAIEEIKRRS
ncbi:MAG: hypothetical protein ACOVNU_00425 [Candidatus Kapaibacteriota bacterium]